MTKHEAADILVLAVEQYLDVYYSQATYGDKNITDWATDVTDVEQVMKDAVTQYKETT